MSNQERLFYSSVGSLGITLIAMLLGYVWGSVVHYRFTLLQRKVWNYYVLCSSSFPVLVPLTVTLGLWLLPVREAIETTTFLLFVWMIIAFYIVRRMSKPGGRLSNERQRPN